MGPNPLTAVQRVNRQVRSKKTVILKIRTKAQNKRIAVQDLRMEAQKKRVSIRKLLLIFVFTFITLPNQYTQNVKSVQNSVQMSEILWCHIIRKPRNKHIFQY